jgi:CubicO group peptidase (beta-lactamase class C family)
VASVLPDEFEKAGAPHLSHLTLRHLLTMSAGLAWDEPGDSLGEMVQSPDWVEHVASLMVTGEAGQRWNYSTGLTHVASALLEEATGEPTNEYARSRLLEPLGIEASRWDFDPKGYDMGGAEVWMRPRDMARLGELYLRGGTLDGVRVLDPQWVEASTRPQLAAYGPYEYSAWWWHRRFAEQEVFFAWGYGGQFIFVAPELDMVVVATSAWWRGEQAATNGQVFAILEDLILPAAN